jgi:hypothetical protein
MADVKRYFSDAAAHPIGDRILHAWETGIAMSLGVRRPLLWLAGVPASKKPSRKQKRRPKATPKR